jgi:hypothetical protein
MAMIKCSECGKDISDKAPACVGCGAPVTASAKSMADFDGDGKIGIGDVKQAWSKLTDKAVAAAGSAVEQGKELLGSQQHKNQGAGPGAPSGLHNLTKANQTESEKECAAFSSALESTIDAKFCEIIHGKPATDRYLTYFDGQTLCASVRNIFKNALGTPPAQILAACSLSEAILAPTANEKQKLIKTAVAAGGGAAGIGMILAAVGTALGWGAGVLAGVSAFFVGSSMVGPIGWAVAGVTIAGVAAYFATTSNNITDTDRFIKCLKSATASAVNAIWAEHGAALAKAMKRESAT